MIAKYFTFDEAKRLPVHRWFYYKEGFSPQLVDEILVGEEKIVDVFAGVGTTLLRASEKGIESEGIDASPLAVFVSSVKLGLDKWREEKEEIEKEHEKLMEKYKEEEPFRWYFELFPPSRAFPPSSYAFITKMRNAVENSPYRDFFLLALLSIIPQSSIVVKDGAVLRINKRKRAIPAKEAFRRKIKQMISDLDEVEMRAKACVKLGDARKAHEYIDLKDALVISSPPYLNAVDYSKVYGLELSLLGIDGKAIRGSLISSSIFRKASIEEPIYSPIPIAEHYFRDMEKVVESLRKGKAERVCFVVANAVIHSTHIEVDATLKSIMEAKGFRAYIGESLIRKTRINGRLFRIRESLVCGD